MCYSIDMTSTIKHSLASKARWKKITKEERKRRMSLLAKKRWAKINAASRTAYAIKMLEKRWKKTSTK
jgi:hypothetical protein